MDDAGRHGDIQVVRQESESGEREREIAKLELELGLREVRGDNGISNRGEADMHGKRNGEPKGYGTDFRNGDREDEDREGEGVMASDFDSSPGLLTIQTLREAQVGAEENSRQSEWARWGGEPEEALALPSTPPSSRVRASFLDWRGDEADLSHAKRVEVALDPEPIDRALGDPMSVRSVSRQHALGGENDDDLARDLRDLLLSTRMAPLSGQMLDATVRKLERSVRQVLLCMWARAPSLRSLVVCERMPCNKGRDAPPDSLPLRRMGAKQTPGNDRGKIEQIQVLISQLQVILHSIFPSRCTATDVLAFSSSSSLLAAGATARMLGPPS